MYHDPELAALLEPTQISSATDAPLPRRALGRGTVALLVALRIYVVLAIPVVAYAFLQALRAGQP